MCFVGVVFDFVVLSVVAVVVYFVVNFEVGGCVVAMCLVVCDPVVFSEVGGCVVIVYCLEVVSNCVVLSVVKCSVVGVNVDVGMQWISPSRHLLRKKINKYQW